MVGDFDASKAGQMSVRPGDALVDLKQLDSVWSVATNFTTRERGLNDVYFLDRIT